MIAETLYNVGKELLEIFTKLKEARLDRTRRVADYFSNLAQTIEETSAELKKGEFPAGKCEQLRFHAEKMEETISDLIGEEEARDHAERVLSVWRIEDMYVDPDEIYLPNKEEDEELATLDQAAGHFRAVAAHLRVK